METIVGIMSYLLGSIPTGFIIGKLSGLDVRKAGSGNSGATSVARVLGKGRGLLSLSADAAKGFIPVFVARKMGLDDTSVALIGTAAFVGHLYPIFLKFKGGKGVATAFGALLGVAPLAVLMLLGVFGVVVLTSRIVSLGSMAAALAAPFSLWIFSYSAPLVAMAAFLAAMIILRHRANIQRLFSGTEPRFGAH